MQDLQRDRFKKLLSKFLDKKKEDSKDLKFKRSFWSCRTSPQTTARNQDSNVSQIINKRKKLNLSNVSRVSSLPQTSFKNSKVLSQQNEKFRSNLLDLQAKLANYVKDLNRMPKLNYCITTFKRLIQCYQGLQLLTDSDFVLGYLIKPLLQEIHLAVFQEAENLEEPILKELIELEHEVIVSQEKYIPYILVQDLLYNQIKKLREQVEIKEKEVQETKKLSTITLDFKQQEINQWKWKLQNQIQSDQSVQISIQEIINENSQLQNKCNSVSFQLLQKQDENEQLAEQMQIYKKQNEVLTKENAEFKLKNGQMHFRISVLTQDLTKITKANKFLEDQVLNTIVKLQTANDNQHDLERQRDELINENSWLKVRAAAGFDELTPRPNWKEFYQTMNLTAPHQFHIISTSKQLELLKQFIQTEEKEIQSPQKNKPEQIHKILSRLNISKDKPFEKH